MPAVDPSDGVAVSPALIALGAADYVILLGLIYLLFLAYLDKRLP